jgi:hypothetical protein
VLDLEALEAVDAPAHSRRQALDVPRGAADERAELVLREGEERGVLASDLVPRKKNSRRHTTIRQGARRG